MEADGKEIERRTREKKEEVISYLMHQIQQEWMPGQKLPSENTLADSFHTNRNTIRKALDYVKAQGKIYSERGKGFFVSEEEKSLLFFHRKEEGFSEIMEQEPYEYESKLLEWKKVMAGPHECKIFHMEPGQKVYQLKVLRSIGKGELAICYSILPEYLVPELEKHLEGYHSINTILMDDYHYEHPVCQDILMEAVVPTLEEVRLLHMPEGLPLLKQVSVFVIPGIGPVEYFIVRARGDRFRLYMDLS